MTRGQTVAGGDRIGKTIIFCQKPAHAEFIASDSTSTIRATRLIRARCPLTSSLRTEFIDDFSNPVKPPHIAISVDMLDTGIDIPEIVNLVFFKARAVQDKVLADGRPRTRLRKIYSHRGRTQFLLHLDYCQNLEFFQPKPLYHRGCARSVSSARGRSKRGSSLLVNWTGRCRRGIARGRCFTPTPRRLAAMNLETSSCARNDRLVEKYAKA